MSYQKVLHLTQILRDYVSAPYMVHSCLIMGEWQSLIVDQRGRILADFVLSDDGSVVQMNLKSTLDPSEEEREFLHHVLNKTWKALEPLYPPAPGSVLGHKAQFYAKSRQHLKSRQNLKGLLFGLRYGSKL